MTRKFSIAFMMDDKIIYSKTFKMNILGIIDASYKIWMWERINNGRNRCTSIVLENGV